mgnify:CR=1 FL=1
MEGAMTKNLCYRLGETAVLVEDLMVKLNEAIKSATPVDIVFRYAFKEFLLYTSKATDKDDERAIAEIADRAGFSSVVIMAGAYLVTMRISPGGTFIYESSKHAEVLNRELNQTFSQSITTVTNYRKQVNAMAAAVENSDLMPPLDSGPPNTHATKRRRNAAIEERLMDL